MLNFWPFNRRHNLPSRPNRFIEIPITLQAPSLPRQEYIDSRGITHSFFGITKERFVYEVKQIEEEIAVNPNQTVKDVLEKKGSEYTVGFLLIDNDAVSRGAEEKSAKLEQAIESKLIEGHRLEDVVIVSRDGNEAAEVDRTPKLVDVAGHVYRSGDTAYYYMNTGVVYHSPKDGWHFICDDGMMFANINLNWLYPIAAINRRPEQAQKLSIADPDDLEEQLFTPEPELQKLPRGVYHLKDRSKYRAHIKIGAVRLHRDWGTIEEAVACRKGMEAVKNKKGRRK